MTLKLEELQSMVDKIISDYRKLFTEDIELHKARTAIGFQISSLRKYEIEAGMYSSRSIVVLPKSCRLIDLLLIYNSEYGQVKYELIIRPDTKSRYCIYRNRISRYDEDEELNIDSRIQIARGLTKQSTKPKIYNKSVVEGSSRPPKGPPQTLPRKTIAYLCRTKDTRCCYLDRNHPEDPCDDCCYEQEHIKTNI
jgi:hypothetical protein